MSEVRVEIVLDDTWEGGGYFINSDHHRVAISQLPTIQREMSRLRATIARLQNHYDRYPPDYIDKLQQDIDERNIIIANLQREKAARLQRDLGCGG